MKDGRILKIWEESVHEATQRNDIKKFQRLGKMTYIYNPSYAGGRDWEYCSSKPTQTKQS
jgi:hypothetical protein